SVGFGSSSIKWTLSAGSATATTTSTACNVTAGQLWPVAQIGSAQVPLRLRPGTRLADTAVFATTHTAGRGGGALSANFSVPPDGAASYVMNLWTPPGRSVQPKLSLVYNNRLSADHYGVGWQLADLFSQITRCTKTIAQDQEEGPVG